MKNTTRFKELVLAPEILVLPVVPDALCARIARQVGFSAVIVGGYSNSAHLLGKPDVNLLTLTEMAEAVGRIADASDLPVMADGDTGYGNVTNVARTVRLYEKAGAAALFLEDQVSPKRCGHMSGKRIIPTEDMLAKLGAALDARQDPDFMIMARTDAIAVEGFEAALERANRFIEAGADMIFVEAPENLEQMRRIAQEVQAPTMANMLLGGKTPMLPASELEDMGFAMVAHATACTYAIAKTVRDLLGHLLKEGTVAGMEDRLIEFEEFNQLVGLPEIRQLERHYYQDIEED
ncbi:MAG: oxaloacetate decarboxylase [Deltaproteobacteria bacterium]|nr:oxaloacetate decarboxylase [Deltaproteobacteria bacterium]